MVKGLELPNFGNLSLLGPPSEQTSMQEYIAGGKTTSQVTHVLIFSFIPRTPGKTVIAPIRFVLNDGTRINSKAIPIEVINSAKSGNSSTYNPSDPFNSGSAQNKQKPASAAKLDLSQEVFAKIHLDKRRVYLGEQIVASVKVYSSLALKDFQVKSIPTFPGFWSQQQNIGKKEVQRERIGGKEFMTLEIDNLILFPTATGLLEIPSLDLNIIAIVPDYTQNRGLSRQDLIQIMQDPSMIGLLGHKEIPISVSSGVAKVEVLPLPPNPPSSFSGAVGQFTMQSASNKRQMNTGEALHFYIELNGYGNLPLVINPKLNWSKEFEVYEPVLGEEYSPVPKFSGTKAWKYTVIPHNPGNFDLPGYEFTYFDLGQKAYVTLRSSSTPLKVDGAPTNRKTDEEKYTGIDYSKENIKELKGNSIAYNLSNTIFVISFLLPWILSIGLILKPKRSFKEDQRASKKEISERVIIQMKNAYSFLENNDKAAFYNEVTKTYWGYLSQKLNMEPAFLSKSNIATELKKREVPDALNRELVSLIESSEIGSYTMQGAHNMQSQYNRSMIVLSELEKIIL